MLLRIAFKGALAICFAAYLFLPVTTAAPVQRSAFDLGIDVEFVPGDGPSSAQGSQTDYSEIDLSGLDALYFGINPDSPPSAGFDTLFPFHPQMSFVDTDGTTARWEGSSDLVTDTISMTVPTRYLLTVQGLGSDPWIDASTVGAPTSIGAVVDVSSGADFSTTVFFQADYGDGFVPMEEPPFPFTGRRGVSVGYSFYAVYTIPEPSALVLAAMGTALFVAMRVLRRRRTT